MNIPLLKRKIFYSIVGLGFIFAMLGVSGCETGFSGSNEIPLSGPRTIQITPRDKELVVQWTKVAPAKGVAPTYELYWSVRANPETAENPSSSPEIAGKPMFVPTNENQLIKGIIPGLENRQGYYVWVKAVFEGLGKSDFSPVSYAAPIPPPEMPGPVTVYPGHEMLELRWSVAEDASAYEAYYSATGGAEPPYGAEMRTISEPGVVFHGLNNGTGYTVWVRAVNTAGVSGWRSNTGTPSTGAAPVAPAGIKATGGDAKVTVTWDQVHGVKAYKLYYGTTNNFSSSTAGPTVPSAAPENTADITGLSNGVTYYVWVVSSNGAGSDSSPSPFASVSTVAKLPIDFNNTRFVLGSSTAAFPFAQDLPASAFFPEGRPNTDRLPRVQETALANLFADGAAWYLRNKQNKEIDFVFINGGYVDNAILKGSVTVGSLMGIIYSDSRTRDYFVIVTMKGSELKKFFYNPERELSLSAWIEGGDVAGVSHIGRGGANTGFFGAVSSEARYTIEYPQAPPAPPAGPDLSTDDKKSEAEPYCHGRIKPGTLKINGADIEDDTEYRIGTTDYLASGANFTGLVTGRINIELFDILFWQGVAEYIYDRGTISPYTDGRIKIEGGVPLPAPWVNSTWKPDWLE